MVKQPDSYMIDDENPALTDEQLGAMVSFKSVFPEFAAAMTRKQGERGKQIAPVKSKISMRIDIEVINAFKATGKGWHNRIEEVLKQSLPLVKP